MKDSTFVFEFSVYQNYVSTLQSIQIEETHKLVNADVQQQLQAIREQQLL